MKNIVKALVGASCLTFAACDVDQKKEAELPDVDVNASGGQMPEFDVKAPDIDVGTKNTTVQVPTIDVNVPDENEKEEKKK